MHHDESFAGKIAAGFAIVFPGPVRERVCLLFPLCKTDDLPGGPDGTLFQFARRDSSVASGGCGHIFERDFGSRAEVLANASLSARGLVLVLGNDGAGARLGRYLLLRAR